MIYDLVKIFTAGSIDNKKVSQLVFSVKQILLKDNIQFTFNHLLLCIYYRLGILSIPCIQKITPIYGFLQHDYDICESSLNNLLLPETQKHKSIIYFFAGIGAMRVGTTSVARLYFNKSTCIQARVYKMIISQHFRTLKAEIHLKHYQLYCNQKVRYSHYLLGRLLLENNSHSKAYEIFRLGAKQQCVLCSILVLCYDLLIHKSAKSTPKDFEKWVELFKEYYDLDISKNEYSNIIPQDLAQSAIGIIQIHFNNFLNPSDDRISFFKSFVGKFDSLLSRLLNYNNNLKKDNIFHTLESIDTIYLSFTTQIPNLKSDQAYNLLISHAMFLYATGNYFLAYYHLKHLLKLNPNSQWLYFILTKCTFAMGEINDSYREAAIPMLHTVVTFEKLPRSAKLQISQYLAKTQTNYYLT
jgi:tetratricopeptide (TPR) repeat protein